MAHSKPPRTRHGRWRARSGRPPATRWTRRRPPAPSRWGACAAGRGPESRGSTPSLRRRSTGSRRTRSRRRDRRSRSERLRRRRRQAWNWAWWRRSRDSRCALRSGGEGDERGRAPRVPRDAARGAVVCTVVSRVSCGVPRSDAVNYKYLVPRTCHSTSLNAHSLIYRRETTRRQDLRAILLERTSHSVELREPEMQARGAHSHTACGVRRVFLPSKASRARAATRGPHSSSQKGGGPTRSSLRVAAVRGRGRRAAGHRRAAARIAISRRRNRRSRQTAGSAAP